MPRLLVVMAAHNSGDTLGTAIRSALRAMPSDSALGVWSDGSTDRTADVLEACQDRRLRYWIGSRQQGSGLARQAILDRIDSEFVANQDSDDVCFPWRFATQVPQLVRADAVFGGSVKFRNSYNWRPAMPLKLRPRDAALSLLIANLFNHSTFTGKRDIVDRAGGYRNLKFAQDYDLWLRAAALGAKIRLSPLPVAGYRISRGQASKTPGYLTRIRDDEYVGSSYMSLLRVLSSGELFGLPRSSSKLPDPNLDPEPFHMWLQVAMDGAAPSFKLYFNRLLAPRGLTWREPSWRA